MAEPSKQAHAPRARDRRGSADRLCIDGVPIGVACAPGERKDGERGIGVSLARSLEQVDRCHGLAVGGH